MSENAETSREKQKFVENLLENQQKVETFCQDVDCLLEEVRYVEKTCACSNYQCKIVAEEEPKVNNGFHYEFNDEFSKELFIAVKTVVKNIFLLLGPSV